jgi:hypothetical protein
METHRKLHFTSIAKGVVNSVPVSGEECVVEVLVIVQSAGSMWVIAALCLNRNSKTSVRKFTLMLHPLFTPIFKLLLTAAERADVQSRTSLTEGCGSAKYWSARRVMKRSLTQEASSFLYPAHSTRYSYILSSALHPEWNCSRRRDTRMRPYLATPALN